MPEDFNEPAATESELVSVVIPAFNNEAYICQALDSALAQDYPAVEVIVVDDGSTDATQQLVSRYAPRIRLLSQANQGAGAARNLGIQNACGKYVAFLDADDVWWPHKLSEQVAALRQSGYRMVYSRFLWWHADANGLFEDPANAFARLDPRSLSSGTIVSGMLYAELLVDCIVWTSTVLLEKSIFDEVGYFDPTLRKGQDYDMWLRLSRQVPMLGLEAVTALYRIHRDSITVSLRRVNYEYLILARAIKKWGETGPDGRKPPYGMVSRRLARSALQHGVAHLNRGDPIVAIASIRDAIKHSNLSAKLVLIWLAAWAKAGIARLWRRPH